MGAMMMNQIMPNFFLFQTNDAVAAVTDGYNLNILKSVITSNPQPGQAIVYRLSYSNLSGDVINWVTIVDTYGSGLTYNSVISSSPAVSAPVHSGWAKTLTFSNISLPANTTGTIDIEFTVSSSITSWTVENAVICSADVENCVSQTANGASVSTVIIQPTPLPQNNDIDLEINKFHGACPIGAWGGGWGGAGNDLWCFGWSPNGSCDTSRWENALNCVSDCGGWWWTCTNMQTTYASWDFVYFTLEFKNNGTQTANNVAIVDRYDTDLIFDSIYTQSNPGFVWTPYVIENDNIGNKVSFSDGFSLTAGQVVNVVLKYKVKRESGRKYLYNYAEIGSMRQSAQIGWYLTPRGDTDSSIRGVQQAPPYSAHNSDPFSYLLQIDNETAQTNNFSQVQISLPTYDLQVTKSLTSGTPGWGNTVTFRVSFVNNGPARKNLELTDTLTVDQWSSILWLTTLLSYTTGPGVTLLQPSATWGSTFYTILDVAANSNGYIDMTFKYPEWIPSCNQPDSKNRAVVTIPNLVEEWNDTDVSNNVFTLSLWNLPWISGAVCGGREEFDYAIDVSSNAPSVLCPGDIIEITNTVSKDSHDRNLDSFPFISSNLSNSTALDSNNLIYIGTTSVWPSSRWQAIDRNAGYMQNIHSAITHAMDKNLTEILDQPLYDFTPAASVTCPNRYGSWWPW